MIKQITLSELSDDLAEIKTKKKEFLNRIDRIVPWDEWLKIIEPHYYSQFTLKKEDRARSREVKEEREKRRKDLRLAQNFSMGLRSGE